MEEEEENVVVIVVVMAVVVEAIHKEERRRRCSSTALCLESARHTHILPVPSSAFVSVKERNTLSRSFFN